jgi:hypothetical protein
MLGRVALVGTDVSEEPGASFIRVTKISELGTTLAVTSTVLARDTAFNSTMPPHSPQKPGTWTTLLGRPFRLNYALPIRTQWVVSVSVKHGSLLLTPPKLSGHDRNELGYTVPTN